MKQPQHYTIIKYNKKFLANIARIKHVIAQQVKKCALFLKQRYHRLNAQFWDHFNHLFALYHNAYQRRKSTLTQYCKHRIALLRYQFKFHFYLIKNFWPNLWMEFLYRVDKLILKNMSIIKRKWEFCWRFIINQLLNHWNILQPKIDQLVNTSIAITVATSTLQLSIHVTPVIFSVLTVLAAAPIMSDLLPGFLFSPKVLFGMMAAVSIYAGYSKYSELVSRAKLDHQIEINKQKNILLKSQVLKLEQRLNQIEQHVPHHRTYLPSRQSPKQNHHPINKSLKLNIVQIHRKSQKTSRI